MTILPGAEVTARRIRQIRERKGWSQRELAVAVGVAQSTICHWETARNAPHLPALRRIALIGEVSIGWLIGDKAVRRG